MGIWLNEVSNLSKEHVVNYYTRAYLMASLTLPFDAMTWKMMAWTSKKKVALDRSAKI